MEIQNTVGFFYSVATTTGQLVTDTIPFFEMWIAGLVAVLASGGIMLGLVAMMRHLTKGR